MVVWFVLILLVWWLTCCLFVIVVLFEYYLFVDLWYCLFVVLYGDGCLVGWLVVGNPSLVIC